MTGNPPSALNAGAKQSDVPYGHASILLLGERSEATEPYNKYANLFLILSPKWLVRCVPEPPPPYSRGKALVWDFTCVHRLAASYTGLSNHVAATVAEQAEFRKLRTYQKLEQNYTVQPIAIESLRGIGPDSYKFLKDPGSLVSGNTLEPAFLGQRLVIAVQRGNAACLSENLQSLYSDNKDC